MNNFDFDTEQAAMAALYEHLQVAHANHGATFILVPLACALGETAKRFKLSEAEKQRLVASLTEEFETRLSEAVGLTNKD